MSTELENTSIEITIAHEPSVALLDPKKKEELYAFLESEIAAFVPDTSTEASRKKIAALAYKVSRTKSAIDDAGAQLKSEWLKKSQAIDVSRKEIRDKLDVLRDKARKPLTDWEEAEERRVKFVEGAFMTLHDVAIIKADDTSETIAHLLKLTEEYEIAEGVFQGDYSRAMQVKQEAVRSLHASLARVQQQEAERVELARLRAEKEERDERDRQAAEAAELARLNKEREEREAQRLVEKQAAAKAAEEKRAALEAAKIAQAAQEAETKARREIEEAARKEAEQKEAAHAAGMARLHEEWAQVDRLRQAELLRMCEEKEMLEEHQRNMEMQAAKAREAAEAQVAAERKLEANKKHRKQVKETAIQAMMVHGRLNEELAARAIGAIEKGQIPAVSISFKGEA